MNKTKFLLLAFIAIVGISFAAILVFNLATGTKPYSVPPEQKRSRAEIKAACQEHIRKADREAHEAISRRAATFSTFIESKKGGAGPFSEEIVSLYGKWRAAKLYIPLTDDEGHKKYVLEKFAQHIFTTEELAAAVRRVVDESAKDLDGIENELAVTLRQEILGHSLTPKEIPIAAEELKKAVDQIVAASQWDVAKTVGNLAVSEVVAQFASQVFVRLGVSAGILSASAANSWWTFGGAFVIGAAVDLIWEWYDDPAGDIEREMKTALESLSINGSAAIRDEINKVITQRKSAWAKIVEEKLP